MRISTTTGLGVLTFAVLLAGCTTGGQVRKDEPTPPPPPKREDPMAAMKARFEAAYFEIACQASGGKDPLSTVMPIEPPSVYLEKVDKSESGKRDRAEKTILRHGFQGITEFLELIARMKADARYWQTVQDRYIDELINCAK